MNRGQRVLKAIKIRWLLSGWFVATLLMACGDANSGVLTLPTPQTQAGIVAVAGPTTAPTVVAVSATPVIVSVPGLPTVTPAATTSLPPTPTSSSESPFPTRSSRTRSTPTVAAAPTTQPAAPTSTTQIPTPTTDAQNSSTPTPLPTVTPVPTVNLTPAPPDAVTELKVIKAGYDALVEHYYTPPNIGPVAQKGLEEAAKALNVAAPAAQSWGTDNAANWSLFEAQFNGLVGQAKVQLPRGALAHRVVNAFAVAVGDLHTYFLDEKRSDSVARMGRGDNSTLGFGAYYVSYQNGYYVQRLVKDSPAQLGGVLVGDRLTAFDGQKINPTVFGQLGLAVADHTYKFEFARPGQAQPVSLLIQYRRYVVPTAEWRLVSGHIGFILINTFQLDVTNRLDEAIADLRRQGADSLVIDLRFNGGGYNFDRVAGRFVADGTLLGNFTNRQGTSAVKAHSDGHRVDPPLPLVVLIDHNSASASEIFSLAIQDNGAGRVDRR